MHVHCSVKGTDQGNTWECLIRMNKWLTKHFHQYISLLLSRQKAQYVGSGRSLPVDQGFCRVTSPPLWLIKVLVIRAAAQTLPVSTVNTWRVTLTTEHNMHTHTELHTHTHIQTEVNLHKAYQHSCSMALRELCHASEHMPPSERVLKGESIASFSERIRIKILKQVKKCC